MEQTTQTTTLSETIQKHIHAAWCCASATLWKGEEFNAKEKLAVLGHLQKYFSAGTSSRQVGISDRMMAFCERVLLKQAYLSADHKRYLPRPSVWFDPQYPFGFTGTLGWWKSYRAMRGRVAAYKEAVFITAGCYVRYVEEPGGARFMAGKRELREIGAGAFMDAFCGAVVNWQYSAC